MPYATAYRALFHRAATKPGETILVHGATGGVGLAAVQIAYAHGIRVLGTGGTDKGLQTVRQNGADAVFNHTTPGYLDDVMKATGGRGVDVVLEMAAHINLDKDLIARQPGPRRRHRQRGRRRDDARQAMGKDATILGDAVQHQRPGHGVDHSYMMAGLPGTLKPVACREFPLAERPCTDAVMASGALGKIVLLQATRRPSFTMPRPSTGHQRAPGVVAACSCRRLLSFS